MRNTSAENRRGHDQIPQHCVTRTVLRVRFSETDGMGIVNHARFLGYFEIAREEYMRRRGVDFKRVFATEHHLPLSQMYLRFDRPVRFDDLLTVQIRLAHLTRAQLRFEYRVMDSSATAESLAFGWTDHVFTTQDLKLHRMPRDLMEQLLSPERQDGDTLQLHYGQNGQPQSET